MANLKALGAEPFIIPAMGSHGGATAEGQVEMLHALGISEKSVDAPIKATMDVVQVGVSPDGMPVYFDMYAEACHSGGPGKMSRRIAGLAQTALEKTNVVFALGIQVNKKVLR